MLKHWTNLIIIVNDDNKIADFYGWVTRDVQKVNFQSCMYLIPMSKIFAFIMNIFYVIKYTLLLIFNS